MDEESVQLLCVCWIDDEDKIQHCAMHRAAPAMYIAAFKALHLLKFFAHFIADHRSSEELFNDERPGESKLTQIIAAIDELRKAAAQVGIKENRSAAAPEGQ